MAIFTVDIPDEINERAKAQAKKNKVSKNAYILIALKKQLKKDERSKENE